MARGKKKFGLDLFQHTPFLGAMIAANKIRYYKGKTRQDKAQHSTR
jgi:hypothetical protein